MNVSLSTESKLKLLVLEEMHRAFDSGLEGASERQRALLSYLVTEELEGRGERIKAYAIATEVFGRPANFDPQLDSIVRVEVGRLRQTLDRYYLTEGKRARILISIPKGQYRPVFTQVQTEPAQLSGGAAKPANKLNLSRLLIAVTLTVTLALAAAFGVWTYAAAPSGRSATPLAGRGPVVAVAPFEFHSDREGRDFIAGGLQADLADVLSDYQWLTVIPLESDPGTNAGGDAAATPDFVVRASLRLIGDGVKATVLLLDGRSGVVRWTKHYDMRLSAGDIMAMQRDVVAQIGRDVGNPFGIVTDIALAQRSAVAPASDEALTCQLRAFYYWRTFKTQDYAPAWRCFEAAEARGPLDAETLAIGAILTLDPQNLRVTNRSLLDARAEATAIAARAASLDQADFLTRVAGYATTFCNGDQETFRTLARETIERFPNNPIALADVGARFVLGSGDHAEGLALIERARAIAADLTPADTIAVAVDALRRGNFEPRSRLERTAARTDSAIILSVALALAAARGDAAESERLRHRLADLGYADQRRIGEALDSTCWSQDTRDLVKSKITLAFQDARAQ